MLLPIFRAVAQLIFELLLRPAVVLGVQRLNRDPWLEKIGSATGLNVDIREPSTAHTISLLSPTGGTLAGWRDGKSERGDEEGEGEDDAGERLTELNWVKLV